MAQETDAQLTARSLIIRNETVALANTKERHDDMNKALIDSKINNLRIDTDVNLGTADKDIADKETLKTYIANRIADLVNSSPAALDTLKELADALGGDAAFATTVTNALATKEVKLDSVAVVVSGGTITLDMNSLRQRIFIGNASFGAAKTIALSNTTNALLFDLHINISALPAPITLPTDHICDSDNWDGTVWTPVSTGKYELVGSWDSVSAQWKTKILGPFL